MAEDTERVNHEALRQVVCHVFQKLGVPHIDACVTAGVLVAADLRGAESHGVARLPRYVNGLRSGLIQPVASVRVITESPASLVVDGGAGLGQVVGKRAMELCIEKAEAVGCAMVAVRNSNHYGIAGYYAMMALQHNMIGFSFTNSRPLAVPTFGRSAIIGTNPIAVAVPCKRERPFVLDMATTTVPIGKIEVAQRHGRRIPLGWAVDKAGVPTGDPAAVLDGGGLLPLGGTAENAGYKGYGLSVLLDILCGALSGAAISAFIGTPGPDGKARPSNVGHFFMALRIDTFRPVDAFKVEMDALIRTLRDSPKAEGESHIYVAGEKECALEEQYRREGIPLYSKVAATVRQIAGEVGVEVGDWSAKKRLQRLEMGD